MKLKKVITLDKKLIDELQDKDMTVKSLYDEFLNFYDKEKGTEIPTELKIKNDAIKNLQYKKENIKKDSTLYLASYGSPRTLQNAIEYIS